MSKTTEIRTKDGPLHVTKYADENGTFAMQIDARPDGLTRLDFGQTCALRDHLDSLIIAERNNRHLKKHKW